MGVESSVDWVFEVLVWTMLLELVTCILWQSIFIRRWRRFRFFSAGSQWWLVGLVLISLGCANTWMSAGLDFSWGDFFEALFNHAGPLVERITPCYIEIPKVIFVAIAMVAEITLLVLALFLMVENIKEARARARNMSEHRPSQNEAESRENFNSGTG